MAQRKMDEKRGMPWHPSQARQRVWFEGARAHGILHDSWFEVFPGAPEWVAWEGYFGRLGWRPVTFGMREPGDYVAGKFKVRFKSWTAPCRWPADLAGLEA